jgi:acetyl esterase/lipase
MKRNWGSLAILLTACAAHRQYLGPDDFEHPPIPYTARFAYGPDTLQHADLRLPKGTGPFPVAVVVHGGCWRAWHTCRHMEEVAQCLTDKGWATWNVEYRTVDRPGGGWPGTFLDVGAATDYLRELAAEFPVDLTHVVAVGHSAGGHLALWLAARPRIPSGTQLYLGDPLQMAGVVSLAGIPDLRRYYETQNDACGEGVRLVVGGPPDSASSRYVEASPAELLPLRVPQLLIHGEADKNVPLVNAQTYARRAREHGDHLDLAVIPRAAHFELMAPRAKAWERIEGPLVAFLASIHSGEGRVGSP